MKISAKARYGLAAVLSMAEKYSSDECITVISLSEKLNISKIYLEQVFSLLKRGGVVTSTKGAQGGYHLARQAEDISVFDVLSAIEAPLFEKTEHTLKESNNNIEKVMREMVFDTLDSSIAQTLKSVSIEAMLGQIEKYRGGDFYMYYL